jgi:DNA-binding transcriptional regulator YiaG
MNSKEAVELTEVRRLLSSGEARRTRTASGLSLSEVAGVVGVSTAAISRWETGDRRPTGRAALAYGRLLARLEETTATP